ncbi:MAG: AEC family transporter [Bacteroidales bacterium]|nr:AEC family transporter [Bacteroidales bacterium]
MAAKKKTETTNTENSQETKKTRLQWRKSASAEKTPSSDPDLRDIKYQEGMRYNQDTRQRKTMVRWVAVLISVWLITILGIMCLKGANIFEYDSSEIIALLTTTTANVIALGYIVLKGLFGDVNIK